MKIHKLLTIFSIALVAFSVFNCSKIMGDGATTKEGISYQITEGACGEITFEEHIGTDSLSAVESIRQGKVKFFDHSNFMIKSIQLKIEDQNGIASEEEFFALHILVKDSLHLHAVSEIITNEGDLYNLSWCAD